MTERGKRQRRPGAWATSAFLAVWVLATTAYVGMFHGAVGLPAASFVVLGMALPAIALAMTRAGRTVAPAIDEPGRALVVALGYVALFSIVVLGWGFGAVRAAVAGARSRDASLIVIKVLTMVVVPLALMGRGERRTVLAVGSRARSSVLMTVVLGGLGVAVSALATGATTGLHEFSSGELAWGLVHALIDLPPNLADFIHMWR